MSPETGHISVSNPLSKDNEVWATCHLENNNDARNICILTRGELMIRRKGRDHSFNVKSIDSLTTGRRKLLLPLVLGGILAPLSLLAIFNNFLTPNLTLPVFVAALFCLYLGFTGTATFIIRTDGKENYVFLRAVSENISRFVVFANVLIKRFHSTGDIYFYAIIPKEYGDTTDDIITNLNKNHVAKGIILYLQDQLPIDLLAHNKDIRLIRIEPLKLTQAISVTKGNGAQDQFTIKSINEESVLSLGFPEEFLTTFSEEN